MSKQQLSSLAAQFFASDDVKVTLTPKLTTVSIGGRRATTGLAIRHFLEALCLDFDDEGVEFWATNRGRFNITFPNL